MRPGSGQNQAQNEARNRGEIQEMAKDFKLKPLEDRIIVQPAEAEETTASGLVIPDTAKEKPQDGEVVEVGPGRIDDNGNRVPARRRNR